MLILLLMTKLNLKVRSTLFIVESGAENFSSFQFCCYPSSVSSFFLDILDILSKSRRSNLPFSTALLVTIFVLDTGRELNFMLYYYYVYFEPVDLSQEKKKY